MKKNTKQSYRVFAPTNSADTFLTLPGVKKEGQKYWRWGDDNLFPSALALMARRSTTHRRIINDKANYVSGKGFAYDVENEILGDFVDKANGEGETLRQVMSRVAFDKVMFGNAFLEIVTDSSGGFLSAYHQDATKCRVAKDRKSVIMHHNWRNYSDNDAVSIPIFPAFAEGEKGTLRSMIYYKEYEPMFENYGVPSYIAGMNVSAIAYKTDSWNISRLDNSFQLSGIMMLDAVMDSEYEAERIEKLAKQKFSGEPGQVMFVMKSGEEKDNSRFIPVNSSNEGDWKVLHDQATSDIVVAHSWFRSLSGLDYSSGFNSERILHEYEIALNTVILSEQEQLLEPLRRAIEVVLKTGAESLNIINKPPTRSKPLYMRVWEARKADGLEYDPQDSEEQLFLAQITKYALKNID